MRFVHDSLPQRVCFGTGEAGPNVQREVGRLGASRVMVISSLREAPLADKITADVPVALRHHDVVMHVPVDVADRAREAAAKEDVDVVVAIGGGSTTGLAKAIALTSGVPIIAVPTTYAGSEATAVWGLTSGDVKTTGSDAKVLPRVVVYDAALTVSLPTEMSVASGLNALAHCVDSLWAPNADPINAAFATEGIRALAAGLPAVVAEPSGIEGREQALYAAYVSAVAFASAGSALHHKICHVLGGKYNLPHAQTHATVLPYVLAFNGPAAPEAAARIASAFGTAPLGASAPGTAAVRGPAAGGPAAGTGSPGAAAAGSAAAGTGWLGASAPGPAPQGAAAAAASSPGTRAAAAALEGLQALRAALDAPRALRDYGLTAADIPAAAEAILPAVPPSNPRPVTAADLERLLRAAWAGADPREAVE